MEDKPIGARLNEISKLFRETVRKYAQELGMSGTHFHIIHYLARNKDKNITQNDLCDFLHFKAPTISLTLKDMENEGLIIREKSKEDVRKTYVRLSSDGIIKAQETQKAFKNSDSVLLDELSKEELAQFYSYLDRLKEAMLKKVK